MDDIKSSYFRLPFPSYDMFNYLLPGVAFLLTTLCFEYSIYHQSATFLAAPYRLHYPLIDTLSTVSIISAPWAFQVLLLIAIVLFCYIIGHIIATVSSLSIERVLVYKGYGWPYETLLGVQAYDNPASPIHTLSRFYYRALFFWGIVILYFYYYGITISHMNPDFVFVEVGLINILARFGHRLNVLASRNVDVLILYYLFFILLKGAVTSRIVMPWLWHGEGQTSSVRKARTIVMFLVTKIFCGLPEMLSRILSRYINTRNQYNDCFLKHYRAEFALTFDMDPDKSKTNNFWFSLLYVKDHSPLLAESIDNWRRLSGFARNLATAFFLSFAYGLFFFTWQGKKIHEWNQYSVKIPAVIPLIYLAVFALLLLRFYYIYVHYFTKYIFRCFVYLSGKTSQLPRISDKEPSAETSADRIESPSAKNI